MTQTKTLTQRLIRGSTVVVGSSFKRPALRGQEMIVASKGPVKCNKGDRCAGDWCNGQALFVADPSTNNEEKELGWRGGTTKICLTHLSQDGEPLVTPSVVRVAQSALESHPLEVVTWEDLANAVADRDYDFLTILARRLKKENETLKSQVIDAQQRLIEHLQA